MPVVVDQKPTTGTRAVEDGVRVGVAAFDRSGPSLDDGAGVEAVVRFASGIGDGCAGAHDITMATIAATPIHGRAIRDPRIGPA
jgi:hypothetical protein